MAKKKAVPKKSAVVRVRNTTRKSPHGSPLNYMVSDGVPNISFPIIGIGASAGGLEAFTQLLDNLPKDSNMAFVFVQHLDPKHESMLTDILARSTKMPVQEVEQGMKVMPNHVYVIPPNTDMDINSGVLNLSPRMAGRGQHMPIDHFFKSLADDQQTKAIGVILSGTASDGTVGLSAIKAEGGITFSQDEKTAKYDGMPRSAIQAGVVDFVMPPAKIARELVRIGCHPYLTLPRTERTEEVFQKGEDDYKKIFLMLRNATGVDFSQYKPSTIKRRVVRRMLLLKIDVLDKYVKFIKDTPDELRALYHDLLINVTSFFRDREVFEALKTNVFPRLIKDRPADIPIRIWVAGCSTGEEVYSIAICLMEYMSDKVSYPTQIFATDISEQALEKARAGIYNEGAVAEVSAERLRLFFARVDGGYQISKGIRDMCVFARQDLAKDPPFSKVDLISCRNVLIYLGQSLQKRVIPTFHYALNPSGVLMLGNSETIGGFAELFTLMDKKNKIYAKVTTQHRMYLDFTANRFEMEKAGSGRKGTDDIKGGFDLHKEADRLLLARFAPAGVLVNDNMDILQFRGQTGAYLEPASGPASLNVLKMAREGLLLDLHAAINEAKKKDSPVRREGLRVRSNGNESREVNIEVLPVKTSPMSRERCFLILFEDGAAIRPTKQKKAPKGAKAGKEESADNRLEQVREELAATKEYLKSTIEQHEATNEELRSALEEIQSSNEELQSTNEELETAKEELQSTNEELTTVNEELQNRNLELSQTNNDIVNLLGSVNIPIIILGNDLRIRRFTQNAEKVLNLIPTDIGRPLSDLRLNIEVPDINGIISKVTETLETVEIEIQDREGRWYFMRLRPYRTVDNKIDGVIITFIDIDAVKTALKRMEGAYEYAQAIVETLREPLLVLDADLRVKTANHAFYELFKMTPEETENKFIFNLAEGRWKIPRLKELLEEILPKDTVFQNFEMESDFPRAGHKRLVLNARRVVKTDQGIGLILLAMEEQYVP